MISRRKKKQAQVVPPSSPPAETEAPARKPRRWRRWLWRGFLTVVVLVVLARIAVPFVLPSVLDGIAADMDLTCVYEDLDLSLATGEIRLWNLRVAPRPAEGEPVTEPVLAHLEHVDIDVDISALFTGVLRVHRVEVDGFDLRVERDAKGQLLWARHAPKPADPVEPPPEPETPADAEPEPLDLRLPVRIDAVRAQHLRVHVIDPSITPAVDTWVETNVRISNLGVEGEAARISVDVRGADLLDRLGVEGSLRTEEASADLDLTVTGRGLRMAAAQGWLSPMGITAGARPLRLGAAIQVKVRRDEADPQTADVVVDVRDVHLGAGATDALRVRLVHADLQDLGGDAVLVPEVRIEGIRGRAGRLSDGALRVAGLEVRPAPATGAPAPSEPAVPVPATPPAATADAGPAPLRLGLARLADVQLTFVDEGVSPAVTLEAVLDELALRDLSTDAAAAPSTLTIRGALPGVFDQGAIHLSLTPLTPNKQVEGTISAKGITLARLAPYLRDLGLASEWKSGEFGCRLSAQVADQEDGLHARLDLSEVRLADGEELLALDSLRVANFFAAASGERITIEEVGVSGVRGRARRDAEGAIHTVGIRTLPEPIAAAPTDAKPAGTAPSPGGGKAPDAGKTPAPAAGDAGGPPTRVVVAKVRFEGLGLRFEDAAVPGGCTFATVNSLFEIQNFCIGGPSGGAPDTATLTATIGVEDLMRAATLRGGIVSHPGALDLSVQLNSEIQGLDLRKLAPYLRPAGIEPVLQDGRAVATIAAAIRAEKQGDADVMTGFAKITDVQFGAAGAEPALALVGLELQKFTLGDAGFQATTLTLDQPLVRVAREADGTLVLPGIRVPPPADLAGEAKDGPSREAVPATVPPATAGKTEAAPKPGAGNVAGPEGKPAEETPPAPEFVVGLDALQLRGAKLIWADAAVQPAVTTALTMGLSASRLTTARGTGPMPIDLTLGVADSMDELRLLGSVTQDQKELRTELTLGIRGLRSGALTPYIPEGMVVGLKSGSLKTRLSARMTELAQGMGLGLSVAGIDFRDSTGDPLLACKEIRVDVPRLDGDKRVLEVAEVSVAELQLTAEADGGKMSLLGITLLPPDPKPAPAQPEAASPSAKPETPETASAPAQPAPPAPKPAPWTVSLARLDVDFDRLRLRDRASKTPLGGVDLRLRLRNDEPWKILKEDPEDLPPLGLALTGAVEPGLGALRLGLTTAPFHPDCITKLDLACDGIAGQALTAALPSFLPGLDLSDLKQGTVRAKIETHLRLQRRFPTDIDLARGFGLECSVTGVELRGEPEGEILAGVDGVHIEAPRIKPGGDVYVAEIEIDTPRGRVVKDKAGMHIAGMVLPPPPAPDPAAPPSQPAEKPEGEKVAGTDPAAGKTADPKDPATGANPGVAAAPPPVFRLDRLTVQGLDFTFADRTVEPAMIVPLQGLDLQVDKFTTKAFSEALPVKFSVSLQAGKVDLPKRVLSSSVIAGFVTGLGKAVTGNADDKNALEKRPLLDEIAVDGRLQFFPELTGRVRTNVIGVELSAFRGAAAQSGVTIGDGVFDAGIDTRLGAKGTVDTRANMTLGYLLVDEAAGGPISTYLKLPAPLQTVVFAMRDDADEIKIPFNLSLPEGELSIASVTGQAVSTLSQMIVNAIAASPFRVAGTVTGLIPGMGPEEAKAAEPDQVVPFGAGAARIDPMVKPVLEACLAKLRDDENLILELRHSFGSDDVDRMELLANPTPEQAAQLASRLRQQRAEQSRDFGVLAAQLRSHHAVGRSDLVASETESLRRVAKDLAATEDALDRVLRLLRPGAERRKDRRTRRMALDLGAARLDGMKEALVAMGGANLAPRIEIKRARFQVPEGTEVGSIAIRVKVRQVQQDAEGEAAEKAAAAATKAGE